MLASEAMAKLLTHVDSHGAAHMVDIGEKPVTRRQAVAEARVRLSSQTLRRLRAGETPKGDVLATVRLAGIQAAKRTHELIPLCHALPLTHVAIAARIGRSEVRLTATAEAEARTGVEMEALTAATVAALTLYDMLKAIDRDITFEVMLLEKSGGASGRYRRARA